MMRAICFCATVLVTVLFFFAAKLGVLYLVGVRTTRDVQDAADDLPDTRGAARPALQALRQGDFAKALRLLEGCQEAPCQTLLGEFQLTGLEVPQDLEAARRSFQAAADLGDPDAQYALGVLYSNLLEEDPEQLARNEALSVLYLYAASVSKHHGALMAMGYRHKEGLSVPKSCSTAALNFIEVARRVAEVYSTGMPQAVELVRLGVEKDRHAMSLSEMAIFVEIAASGDASVASAVGKRYLLGIDGFAQDFGRALQLLKSAAEQRHGVALGLLGYMYSLGLGVSKDLDVAFSYFKDAAKRDDPLGHNGLGYIFFQGTEEVTQDSHMAFHHFNNSAHKGSADGMFNLASLYLTGSGTHQSFQKAAQWYTQALDRGHTPAAYALAVMHLNGIGTVRNCKTAVDLLKRVCERGSWVSNKLREAQELHQEGRPNAAAWRFLSLAEAGHEVAQMNVAQLFDTGASTLLLNSSGVLVSVLAEDRVGRAFAQRHYELSAEQGNAFSELRLGDFAYYGWGVRLESGDDEELEPSEAQLAPQDTDMELSLAHYRRTATMRIAGEWMQPFVARASFNLGYMHQFGVGVKQDLPLAKRFYGQSAEADPGGVHTPVAIMSALISLQSFLEDLPASEVYIETFFGDVRFHILVAHLVAMCVLLLLRRSFAARADPRGRGTPPGDSLDEG